MFNNYCRGFVIAVWFFVYFLPKGKCENTLTITDLFELGFKALLTDITSFPTDLAFKNTVPLTNVKFYLIAKNERTEINENFNLIDSSKDTKLIIHGWLENSDLPFVKRMAENFLQKNVNVVAVDWSKDAQRLNGLHLVVVAEFVGRIISDFILNVPNVNLKNFHLLGHSIGAHVAGHAGKWIMTKGKGKISRITGLDPANPSYEFPINIPCQKKLCKGDAEFVDVIHSNPGIFGVSRPYGDVDFFVNGLRAVQPGCEDKNFLFAALCSHQMSNEYYSESILNPKEFVAQPCFGNSWSNDVVAFMGDGVASYINGSFCVYTDYTAPTGI